MSLEASKQIAYSVSALEGMAVAKQVAYSVSALEGMAVAQQVAYVVSVPLEKNARRRSILAMN